MILPVSALNGLVPVAAPPVAAERPVEPVPPLLGEDAFSAGTAFGNGPYDGAPVFRFQRGPDGRTHAVGGEVGIDVRSLGDPPR